MNVALSTHEHLAIWTKMWFAGNRADSSEREFEKILFLDYSKQYEIEFH